MAPVWKDPACRIVTCVKECNAIAMCHVWRNETYGYIKWDEMILDLLGLVGNGLVGLSYGLRPTEDM
jgi:hypothetical protein